MSTITSSIASPAPVEQAARRGIFLYTAVAFAVTWSILGLVVLAARVGRALPASPMVFVTLATLGPCLAAIAAVAYEAGWSGVRALLAPALRWRLSWGWYAVALLGPGLVMLAAFLLWLALGATLPPAPPAAAWAAIPLLIVALFLPALVEEIGWRGYLLSRLQSRLGALPASLVIGVVHACWHLPMWYIPEVGFSGLPFPYYALLVVGLSVLATWLFNNTGGSLLLLGLFHAAINAFPAPWGTAVLALPEGARGVNMQIPVAIVMVVFAAVVALLHQPRTLARSPSRHISA
jgi:uncharacterized protein